MKMDLHKKIAAFIEGLMEHFRGFVLVIVAVVAVLGLLTGYRYYSYTVEEPQYCASCHLMEEAFREWQKGKHNDVVCQKCHQLTMLEQNKLLIAYVLKGNKPLSQTHGREKPWQACRECHYSTMSQGSITFKKSYGHFRHLSARKIACKECHAGTLHNFSPNEKSCAGCHKDKGIHGIGMEGFSCLKCHSFSEKASSMVSNDRCVKCHPGVPAKGPMSGVQCHECHKPHNRIKPKADLCAGACHDAVARAEKHAKHMKKGPDCLTCHKAHVWTVTGSAARTLCGRCHTYKDPRTFVY